MKSGEIIVKDNYIINCYKICKELKEKILANDPRYQFDDSYRKYAFDGEYKNDTNIKVGKLPNDYSLRFVFNIRGLYLGIFKNNYIDYRVDKYFVKKIKFNEVCRTSYCFDFNDLMNGSVLISNEERQLFSMFKSAMRGRRIVFESVECYYLIEEIYKQL